MHILQTKNANGIKANLCPKYNFKLLEQCYLVYYVMLYIIFGALKRIRPYITTSTAVQVYKALIQPHLNYCCSVWDGLRETLSCKL